MFPFIYYLVDIKSLAILAIIILMYLLSFLYKELHLQKLDENVTVLITGASFGLGQELAIELDSRGCNLILWDIHFEPLKEFLASVKDPSKHIIQNVDVSSSKDIEHAIQILKKDHNKSIKKLKHVIACAGVVNGKPVLDLEECEVKRTMDVNFLQMFLLVKHFICSLQQSNGSFTFISSVTGLMSLSRLSDYCASKFALVGFNESLRLELRKMPNSNVTTSIVLPFIINTKMFEGIKIMFPANLFLRFLDKREVALRIIKGIQRKDEWIVIPWFLRFLPLILVLPIWIRNIIFDSIQEHKYMKSFKRQSN